MFYSQQIAAKAVGKVFAGQNLTGALDEVFRQYADLTPQRRAVAQDLSYGALRFYGELNAIAAQLVQKPPKDKLVWYLLIIALYQLQHTPENAFTVVNQAVNAADKLVPRAKSLINAVLRNFLRQQPTILAAITDNLPAQFSYPAWWIDKLQLQYPQHWQAILTAGNQHPPMTLRINTRQTTQAAYLALLQAQGMAANALGTSAIQLHKPVAVNRLPHFEQGWVSVQDYGAQLAATLLDVQTGMHVLDACCAPGGKTTHLLELADIHLTAIDSDARRLQRVQENLQRLQLKAQLLVGNAAQPASWWDKQSYDRILADVPCSASGVVRRHVDIKWLRREEDIAELAKTQAEILSALWQLLKNGGKLLYVTCSVFKEENEAQIARFLAQHADAIRLPLDLPITTKEITDGQLLPSPETDGFFYALLQKR